MVKIARINEIHRNEFDETYAIVRSMKSKSDWIMQEPLLSPSQSLFARYRQMVNDGTWSKEAFDTIYVPQFIKELKQNADAVEKLNEIYRKSRDNKNIALCCFCTDESICHRSIIGGLLQGVGANVIINADYSRYFEIYKQL